MVRRISWSASLLLCASSVTACAMILGDFENGTSGTGGAACAGGAMACTADSDCPEPGTECMQRTCAMGCCGTIPVADNTATLTGQTAKDCKLRVCDGTGNTKEINDDTDVPDAMADCHVGACTSGTPGQDVASAGEPCTSGVGNTCDGNGACVECVDYADCTATAPQCCKGGCLAVAAEVSAGGDYTCAQKTDGTLWCWGYHNAGQLGDGTTVGKSSPVRLSLGACE
jgi:hypothetical protein